MSTDLELLREINGHLYKDGIIYLVIDEFSFHVFVAVIIKRKGKQDLKIRIDWQDNSELTFERFEINPKEQTIFIMNQEFCNLCLMDGMTFGKIKLETYQLFKFNCRSVSFLILVLMGYDSTKLYRIFEERNVLCGLNSEECFTLTEIEHFIEWHKHRYGETTL